MAGPPRLSPEQVIVAKLFEICDRMAEQVPEGPIRSGVIPVTDKVNSIVGSILHIDFFSDGPDDVYIWTNENQFRIPWQEGDAPLKRGESLPVDFHKKTGNVVYLICKAGCTASVRYWKIA